MGAMLGGASTGTYANDKALQIEIVAYSDRATSDRVGGLWVGELSDTHFEFLAEVVAWHVVEFGLSWELHAPPKGVSWVYGSGSTLRMGQTAWYTFDGITAHGGVPGQVHWDTGKMDLRRLRREAKAVVEAPEPDPVKPPIGSRSGMFPLVYGEVSEDVSYWRRLMNDAGLAVSTGDAFDDELAAALAVRFPNKNPKILNGARAARLMRDVLLATVDDPGPVEADTTALNRKEPL